MFAKSPESIRSTVAVAMIALAMVLHLRAACNWTMGWAILAQPALGLAIAIACRTFLTRSPSGDGAGRNPAALHFVEHPVAPCCLICLKDGWATVIPVRLSFCRYLPILR